MSYSCLQPPPIPLLHKEGEPKVNILRKLSLIVFCFIASCLWAAEPNLQNIKQLTFGGENAEAYFSADGKRLIFQSTRDGYPCDQIYTMKDRKSTRLNSSHLG